MKIKKAKNKKTYIKPEFKISKFDKADFYVEPT